MEPGKAAVLQGQVQIYTGNGKGKTTAALGLALRALGRGLTVCFFQFIKGGGPYGEQLIAERLQPGFTIISTGRPGWVRPETIAEDRALTQQALQQAHELLCSGNYDLFVCDELIGAIGFGLVDIEQALELIRSKPKQVELVLTGRNADEQLLQAADLVTEMREIKHYYQNGIPARIGIEL